MFLQSMFFLSETQRQQLLIRNTFCDILFQLMVINEVLLKSLQNLHGETNFALVQTPEVISSTIATISSLYGGDSKTSMSLFGLLQENSLDQRVEKLKYPEGYSNLGFGNWIYEGDITYKTEIRDHRSSRDFGLIEIKGLMDALGNAELLGATYEILSNASFPDKCFMPSTDNGDSIVPSQGQFEFSDIKAETCRLTSCLYRFKKHISRNQSRTVFTPDLAESINCIEAYLCTNISGSCLTFPQENNLRLAYAHAVHDYIFYHLVHFVLHSTVILNKDDIVVSKSQRSLALGYYLNETSNFHSYESNFVPGILEHADSIKDPSWYILRKRISLYNCYDTVEAETNFMWNGKYQLDGKPNLYKKKRTASMKL